MKKRQDMYTLTVWGGTGGTVKITNPMTLAQLTDVIAIAIEKDEQADMLMCTIYIQKEFIDEEDHSDSSNNRQ